jgi:hypothetical protein
MNERPIANCADCRFFASLPKDSAGECRRFPRHEKKRPTDWCGEFVSINERKPLRKV